MHLFPHGNDVASQSTYPKCQLINQGKNQTQSLIKMLNNYTDEIDILSNDQVSDEKIENIRTILQGKLPPSEKLREKILKYVTNLLIAKIKEENYRDSLGLLRFIFVGRFTNPMAEIRKQGVFRVSKANFETKIICKLINEIPKIQKLPSAEERYLRNVVTLLILAPNVKQLKNDILAAAKSSRYFIKTILALAEAKFCDLLWDGEKLSESNFLSHIFYSNKESILSSASYIVQIYRESMGETKIVDSNHIDEDLTDHYSSLIESSFAITNYLKSEIEVDIYDYGASANSKRTAVFVTNEDFETAKEYGYTKTNLRILSQIRRHRHNLNSRKSYVELLEEIWARDCQEKESILYLIKKEPLERIVLINVLAGYGHEANVFSHDYLFSEEVIQLINLMDENYNDEAPLVKICGPFTSLDIFKIQRFFIYLGFMYHKAYWKLKRDNYENVESLRLRSVLPVMKEVHILELFEQITGKPLDDCKLLLTRLTNASIVPEETIDMQYKPVLKIEENYLILPAVFGHSNIIRSLAKSENVHFSVSGKHDYMVTSVSDALITRGFQVKHDFKFGVDEIDIIAAMDEYLFLFECKNPYHPVNEFELRNTYAHLVKGFSQLEKIKARFSDKRTFTQFLKNSSISPHSIQHVHYGIINANRTLSGLSQNGIKVFHAGEFINFLSTGKIISGSEEFATWKHETFDVNDLISYMEGNSVSNDLILHKVPIRYSVKFGDLSLHLRSFEFNLEEAYQYQRKKYRLVGRAHSND